MAGDRFQILKLERSFNSLKYKMGHFFKLEIVMVITIKEGYEFSVDDHNSRLPHSRLTKKPTEKVVDDTKANMAQEQAFPK